MRMRPSIEFAEELDVQLQSGSVGGALKPTMPHWSRTVRAVTGMPVADLARRMGLSQPSVTQLEQNELAGTISIVKLEALAHALDCEFVYGFVPKRPFAATANAVQSRQDAA